MIDSLFFSINAVFPIVLLALFGAILRASKLFSEEFFSQANRFVFYIALPITLFCDVIQGGMLDFGGKVTLYCIMFLSAEVLLLFVFVPLFLKDNQKRGAFIQGAFRSNIAILGVPLIEALFSQSGSNLMAKVMPIMVVLYNIAAVVVLTMFAPAEKKKSPLQLVRDIFLSTIKNPLIIGIFCGILLTLLPISVPAFATKTLGYLDNLTTPLSLLSLGASFRLEKLKGRLGLASLVCLLRCVLVPLSAVCAAILIGFRGHDLGVIFIILGSPTAVASYVMSERMGSDSILSGQIVLMTTVISAFTVFLGTYLLRYYGFF